MKTIIFGMDKYDHTKVEKKWQERWLKEKIFSPNLKKVKKPFYNLMMFPYPSAEGLHVGNMYAFTGADVYGRFQRMQGKDVFEPIGLDGFGIHSENYAIKIGRHPKEHARTSQENFYKQLHMIGDAYDWTKTLETYDSNYYKWTQWLFIKMFKAGLAYKGKAVVNWCPSCKTVLADEQVISGECERCGTKVTKREMESWFFKITKYADRLLKNIEKINWPEKIKTAQRNWIGKSDGMLIEFKTLGPSSSGWTGEGEIRVFTTRPDTLSAVTFLATSKLYGSGTDSGPASKEKIGKFSGYYAVDPLSGRKLPIWDTNYVAPDYGTGTIMGVPAHDERDMEFAKKYKIDIVNKKPDERLWERIEKEGWGRLQTNYHLRDWLISRQRYWGCPIPMIYCKDHDWQPVLEKDLPVLLPDIKDFKPKGDGVSPLHNAPVSWKRVKCPNCGKEAERELDVSDTFLDSSWYFLAYPNLGTKEWGGCNSPFNMEITSNWLPVDAYIGGAEHAVLHLLYSRFVTMVLSDLGYLNFEEPFPFLFGHGLIIKDGAKMSKSKGNIVNPDEYINKFGADALRMYLMFLGPYDRGGDFMDTGIEGMEKFVNRLWRLFMMPGRSASSDSIFAHVLSKLHQTIKGVTEDIDDFKYNTAIAKIMELVNVLHEHGSPNIESLNILARLIAPFAPHLAEEMWVNILGEPFSVHMASWPNYSAKFIKSDTATIVVQVNGRVRSTLNIELRASSVRDEVLRLAKRDEKIAKWLNGRVVKKTIFVPGKLVNFVI